MSRDIEIFGGEEWWIQQEKTGLVAVMFNPPHYVVDADSWEDLLFRCEEMLDAHREEES